MPARSFPVVLPRERLRATAIRVCALLVTVALALLLQGCSGGGSATGGGTSGASGGASVLAPPAAAVQRLPGASIPRFVRPLVIPPSYEPSMVTDASGNVTHAYTISISQFSQQILPPPLPPTTVWGYGGNVALPSGTSTFLARTPAATIEAVRGTPVTVRFRSLLTGPHLLPVDPTLHWADPNGLGMNLMGPFPPFPPGIPQAQAPVPVIPHLHGGEVPSTSDGGPEAWFTACGLHGPNYNTEAPAAANEAVLHYPNTQPAGTLWLHDHALGVTRLNVLAGLAGFYLIRDPGDGIAPSLPRGEYEVPLAIQDRSFNTDGSLFFPQVGNNPDLHPYWNPEFFGDAIMVNGVTWPDLKVEPHQYRLRVLNASNARFYRLAFSNGLAFTQIGVDGSYLPRPVTQTELLLGPAQRADILVDFSTLAPGTRVLLLNDANAPYPTGDPADPNTVGQIMQFTVLNAPVVAPQAPPATLISMPVLTPDAPRRVLVLDEVGAAGGPGVVLLNGQTFDAAVSELPRVGTTEEWDLVNTTMDMHPIHLHLVHFQLMDRQAVDAERYSQDWITQNGGALPPFTRPTVALDPAAYLQGGRLPPDPNEVGWMDTVRVPPGTVTRLLVRFAPQGASPAAVAPGVNLFPFDPTAGPGYVWHCHILDHEDNDMMRPYKVVP